MKTLYKCNRCGRVFDDNDCFERHEKIANSENQRTMFFIQCPNCRCEDLEAGDLCVVCEEGFSVHGLCDSCRVKLKDSLTIIAKALGVSVGKLLNGITCYSDYYHDGL